ncbi:MAG TPA: hypothetical protein VLK65_18405 [Vicinamibacteria bacterium]|nr:hypothetical protein [Vicinamibacteria bacterium]
MKMRRSPVPLRGKLIAFVALSAAAFSLARLAGSTSEQRPASFDNRSLQGSYALVGVGGAHDAASVGLTRFDGAGGAIRKLVLNESDPDGDGRLILTIAATGTYEVTPHGMGTARFVNELPDGSQVPFTFDFVITEAQSRGSGRYLEALALHMVQREPGIAAKLVTFTLTRLTD